MIVIIVVIRISPVAIVATTPAAKPSLKPELESTSPDSHVFELLQRTDTTTLEGVYCNSYLPARLQTMSLAFCDATP